MSKYKPLGYTGRKSSQNKTGQARFANTTEAAAGTSTPSTLSSAVGDLVPTATDVVEGVVTLTDNNSPIATKVYADNLAISGAPTASETVPGILEVSNNAEALALAVDNKTITPLKLGQVLATPAAIGSGTPAGGAFSTLSASGAFSLAGDTVDVAEGGTGSANASDARTALGLAIGTDVQAYDAGLDDLAGLAVTDSNIIVGDGANWVAESGATARTSLGVAIGTDVQAWNQKLDDVAGAAVTNGNFLVGDGANFVAESGATARTSLGLTIGTDVQAYDAGLADIAGLAVTDSNIIVGDGANWVAETGATARTSLGLGSIATQASNSVTITGGSVTGITDITVADGGTGASSLLDNAVLVGSGTAAITALTVGTNGQVLVGSTGADPAFATVGSANTSIANTLGAGTLSLDVDESYLQTATVTVSTAELLALATTPKTLVAAPGADKFIEFLGAKFILNYNSVPYTEAGDNFGIKYTDASGVQVSSTTESTGFIDQAADMITNSIPANDVIVTAAGSVNQALVLDNLGSNFGAGNSEMFVQIRYRIITAGL
jgi:hypothetical protein